MRCFRVLVGLAALGCSSEAVSNGTPWASGPGVELPFPERVALVSLFEPTRPASATALAFNPAVADELWVTLRQQAVQAPCTQSVKTGCAALPGEVLQVSGASTGTPTAMLKRDGNAWHFMRRPSSIAFGDNGNLATCGEARTANYDDDPFDYTGPVLWSSDPAIFGARPEGNQNGRHLDMLHETPFCMGIAHERDNVYWTFNGKLGALDRYDFKEPHEIGGEDHSDGELYRHLEQVLDRVAEVPSHLAIDRSAGELYVTDTGHARVLRVKLGTGQADGFVQTLDRIVVNVRMTGTAYEELAVPSGTLVAPSGIALSDQWIFVTDNATSLLHAIARDGTLVQSLDTGLPAGSLSGIAVGSDGSVYLSDLLKGRAYRLQAAE
ncbi:MAG TPA: hypothetical protein VER33_22785 [Polyangiaceae bacterium]|nr:hypothetical protein [Polyangiaceae bacterium]